MKKMYFSIGEAAENLGLPQSVLRYWETVFPELKPKKGKAKARFYRQQDLETLKKIKHLLREEGFTIEGARRHLAKEKQENLHSNHIRLDRQVFEETRKALREILELLG